MKSTLGARVKCLMFTPRSKAGVHPIEGSKENTLPVNQQVHPHSQTAQGEGGAFLLQGMNQQQVGFEPETSYEQVLVFEVPLCMTPVKPSE